MKQAMKQAMRKAMKQMWKQMVREVRGEGMKQALKQGLSVLALCVAAACGAAAQGRQAATTATADAGAAPQREAADPHAGHRTPAPPAPQQAGQQQQAPQQPQGQQGQGQQGQESAAQKYFTDVELVDQNGRRVRFYSDVLKGKTVVINAFFTTCTSVCPPMSRNLEKVQAALGERVGRDLIFVSITVDPEVDTPERLREYARKFHAGAGWLFLTGEKERVEWALYKVGQYVESKDDHTTVVIVGNERTGLWKKAFGLAKAEELAAVVRSVADDPGPAKTADKGEQKQ